MRCTAASSPRPARTQATITRTDGRTLDHSKSALLRISAQRDHCKENGAGENRTPSKTALSGSTVGVDAQENAHDFGFRELQGVWSQLTPLRRDLLLRLARELDASKQCPPANGGVAPI